MSAPAGSASLPATTSSQSKSASSVPLGVEFHEVSKRFGSLWALRRVSVRIRPGEWVALRGPNGSGKSTLLKVAATLMRPTSGRVTYLDAGGEGREAGVELKARLGFVAHGTLLYDELTAAENLAFFGNLYGLPDLPARLDSSLEAVGLAARRSDLVRTFSRGMRQRLSIARAMLHRPGLLLLDEPFTGLDQQATTWMHATLAGLHRQGCTILMSTHIEGDGGEAARTVWLDSGAVVKDTGVEMPRDTQSGGTA